MNPYFSYSSPPFPQLLGPWLRHLLPTSYTLRRSLSSHSGLESLGSDFPKGFLRAGASQAQQMLKLIFPFAAVRAERKAQINLGQVLFTENLRSDNYRQQTHCRATVSNINMKKRITVLFKNLFFFRTSHTSPVFMLLLPSLPTLVPKSVRNSWPHL